MLKTTISKALVTPPLKGDWDHSCWSQTETLRVDQFRVESSRHRPLTEVRCMYDETGLHIIFRVQDHYVRSIQTALNSSVCSDSCVEFFVQPHPNKGYLNFEINCGGTLHASYIEDHTRTATGFAKASPLTQADADRIGIAHSMPDIVDPEIEKPTTWVNQLFVPFAVISKYTGELRPIAGHVWRGNFYKCGDKTSHPHWAAWAPVRALNFHDPECFGELQFEA